MADKSKNDDKPFFSAIGGNWIKTNTSSVEYYDPRIGSKDTSFRQVINEQGEVGLYTDRKYEFSENPLYEFAVRFLAASLMDFDIGGEGAEDVRNFVKNVNPLFYKELYSALISAIRDGTGYLLKFRNAQGQIRQFKWDSTYNYRPTWVARKPPEYETARDKELDANAIPGQHRLVEISVYTDVIEGTESVKKWMPSYYIRQYPLLIPDDYRNDKIAMLQLLEDDSFPSGRSIGRSSYQHFKALNQALKDDMAVIKKILGTPLAAKLDLSDVDDMTNPDTGVNKRAEAARTFVNSLKDIDWERQDIIAFPNKHDIGYLGLLPGSSPLGDGKIIDIMKHIEPVLSAVLLNFFIPLGLIEQTGANKSIIAQQTLQARKDMIPIKNSFSAFLITQIFPDITPKKVEVFHPPIGVSYEMWNNFFGSGLISREYTTERLGIVDNGNTFSVSSQGSISDGDGSISNDDNPEKRRIEPQRSQAGETGV